MSIKLDKGLEIDRATYEANLELKTRILESRWKNANQMSISYMRSFERLGESYAPLISVSEYSFNTHACCKYVGQEHERLVALENSWQKSKQMSLMFMQDCANRGLAYKSSLSINKDEV